MRLRFPSCGAMVVFWMVIFSLLLCICSPVFFIVDLLGSVKWAIISGVISLMLSIAFLFDMLRRKTIKVDQPSTRNVLAIFTLVAILGGIVLPISLNFIRCGNVNAGSDLHSCDLDGKDFSGKNLRETNFAGATLNDADLSEADLTDADLSRVQLRSANLTDANLTGANLSKANLSDATLTNAVIDDANLFGVDLHGAEGLTVEMFANVIDRRGILLEDWQSIVETAGGVCRGSSLQGAASYTSSDLKPFMIVQSNGNPHSRTDSVPVELRPARAAQIGIVACVGNETAVRISSCNYTGGVTKLRYQYELRLRIVNAQTGRELTSQTLKGDSPSCPDRTYADGSIYGTPVDGDMIADSARTYVNPGGNLPPIILADATSDSPDDIESND